MGSIETSAVLSWAQLMSEYMGSWYVQAAADLEAGDNRASEES